MQLERLLLSEVVEVCTNEGEKVAHILLVAQLDYHHISTTQEQRNMA